MEAVDPSLDFPYFPDPFDENGVAIPRLEGDNVIIPLWYWIKITEYVVDVEKTRQIYEAWKKIYLFAAPGPAVGPKAAMSMREYIVTTKEFARSMEILGYGKNTSNLAEKDH